MSPGRGEAAVPSDMRVAVAGATGRTGREITAVLDRAGHASVAIARSRGVDVLTGAGLDHALSGVDAVVDVTNFPAADLEAARRAFGTATRHLLEAEARAGVRHHVLLSIVGIDRGGRTPHYEGKRTQEALVAAGPVPFTIQRATQFFDFPEMVVGWVRKDQVAVVPPLLLQPVAVSDVAQVLVEIAMGPARMGRAPDLAGPSTEDFVDMARRTLQARGDTTRLVPSWRGLFGVEAAGEVLLPDPGARLGTTTFDEWLAKR